MYKLLRDEYKLLRKYYKLLREVYKLLCDDYKLLHEGKVYQLINGIDCCQAQPKSQFSLAEIAIKSN